MYESFTMMKLELFSQRPKIYWERRNSILAGLPVKVTPLQMIVHNELDEQVCQIIVNRSGNHSYSWSKR